MVHAVDLRNKYLCLPPDTNYRTLNDEFGSAGHSFAKVEKGGMCLTIEHLRIYEMFETPATGSIFSRPCKVKHCEAYEIPWPQNVCRSISDREAQVRDLDCKLKAYTNVSEHVKLRHEWIRDK